MGKRALVVGGTGAIGVYLVPELLKKGFEVDVTSRVVRQTKKRNLRYIKGDAHDTDFLSTILTSNVYDVVIDFMNYTTAEFKTRYSTLLENCKHYIFLSSYRVFSNAEIITEMTPRLLDISKDRNYLKTDEYALAKARQEDMLKCSMQENWTIVRPAITYSTNRFQLGAMEAEDWLWRATQGLPVIFPKDMLDKITTLTWAGDVARLISELVLKKKAYTESFNIATTENHTWREVIEFYNRVIDLDIRFVDIEKYIHAMGGDLSKYQVNYDRMYNRKIDNSKIADCVGARNAHFRGTEEGLEYELKIFLEKPNFKAIDYAKQERMDTLSGVSSDTHVAGDESSRSNNSRPLFKIFGVEIKPRTRLRLLKRKIRLRTRCRTTKENLRYRYGWRKYKNASGVILTMTTYYNYGNIIQRYALQSFLEKNGLKFVSYWVDYTPEEEVKNGRYKFTSNFVDRYIRHKPFDSRDVFPAYIVGSDQVWRNWGFVDEKKELGYYFLNFLQSKKPKRVAYAASFGKSSLGEAQVSRDFVEYIKPHVKKFDGVSVRERSGVDIVKNAWGVNATQVLDPTMLLDSGEYSNIISNSPYTLVDQNGIFAYILKTSKRKTDIINDVKHQTKTDVHYLNLLEQEVLPPLEQWLKNIRDADIVVTDSFHGAVFAIINNRNFWVIENAHGGVTRLTSLLKLLGLEGRMVSENDAPKKNVDWSKPVDWNNVNRLLAEQRRMSAQWLLKKLGVA